MEEIASFGAWLKRRRKALDLTQDALARQVGCSVGLIRMIESDARRPSRQVAARLADQLQIAPAEHAAFIKAARAELAADRLAPPVPSGALPRHRSNLPVSPTPLIGREHELVRVRELLRRVDVRLLSLTGPGGVGKTRLGLAAAAELLNDFPDGVWFVPLAPAHDPDLLAMTITQALGVRETGDRPVVEGLKEYLRDKALLLLLDNFEQLLAAASLLAELLAAAKGLKLLVTSRAILHLSAEHEFVVPPLALPAHAPLPPFEQLSQYEAVRLFIARSQAARSDFALTTANASVVVEICYRLDGLPLAIELAAARSKLLAPEVLLARLGNRLALLTGGARDLPQRQQTLRETLSWSYDLLGAGEQTLFARLAVFVGGCTLEGAESVCNAARDLSMDVLDGLAALVDHSLLQHAVQADGQARFTMLETIREYALERLAASTATHALRQAHAAYYLQLAEQAEVENHGPAAVASLDRLERELDNLRAALAWYALQPDGAEGNLRLAASLFLLWVIHCHFTEGSAQIEAALMRWHAGDSAPSLIVAQAQRSAGWLAFFRGDALSGEQLCAMSLKAYRALGNTEGMAWALGGMGLCAHAQGDPVRGLNLMEESLTLSRMTRDLWSISMALSNLAWMYMDRADYERAKPIIEEFVARARSLQHPYLIAEAILYVGYMAMSEGEPQQAQAYFAESAALYRTAGDQHGYGRALEGLGDAAVAQRDGMMAHTHYQASLTVWREIGHKRGMSWALQRLGWTALAEGDAIAASTCFVESLTLGKELGYIYSIPGCLAGLAALATAQDHFERATRLFGVVGTLIEDNRLSADAIDRPAYDHNVAAVRAQLDETTFAAEWATGRALTLEQALAEALELHRWLLSAPRSSDYQNALPPRVAWRPPPLPLLP